MSQSEKYPLIKVIEERLVEINKTKTWLAVEIEKSPRWLERVEGIDEINITMVKKISAALGFDLLADYVKMLGIEVPAPNRMAEPAAPYVLKHDAINIQITVTCRAKEAGKILTAIQDLGGKNGFKIE